MISKVFSFVVVLTILSITLTVAGQSVEKAEVKKAEELGIVRAYNSNIKLEVMIQSLELYNGLSAEKQAEIKEKMVKMAQERTKAINVVEQKIKEMKIQKLNLVIKEQAERISEVRSAIQKLGIRT